MRCYICNSVLAEPRYNSDTEAYEPCEMCMLVIHDTLAGFHDRPSADEDELGLEELAVEAYHLTIADDYENNYEE